MSPLCYKWLTWAHEGIRSIIRHTPNLSLLVQRFWFEWVRIQLFSGCEKWGQVWANDKWNCGHNYSGALIFDNDPFKVHNRGGLELRQLVASDLAFPLCTFLQRSPHISNCYCSKVHNRESYLRQLIISLSAACCALLCQFKLSNLWQQIFQGSQQRILPETVNRLPERCSTHWEDFACVQPWCLGWADKYPCQVPQDYDDDTLDDKMSIFLPGLNWCYDSAID